MELLLFTVLGEFDVGGLGESVVCRSGSRFLGSSLFCWSCSRCKRVVTPVLLKISTRPALLAKLLGFPGLFLLDLVLCLDLPGEKNNNIINRSTERFIIGMNNIFRIISNISKIKRKTYVVAAYNFLTSY